jgi:GDP-4-dehydro-6-deoxy-D-mannose reductase
VRVLLTGIAGFAGSYLAELLVREPAVELHGVVHRHDRRIAHLAGQLQLHRGDLRNALWVNEVIERRAPDYHPASGAAWSDVGGSWQQPWTTYELNIQSSSTCWKRCARWQPPCRTLIVSSNEVYGLVRFDRTAYR